MSLPPLSEFSGSAPGKGRKVFLTKVLPDLRVDWMTTWRNIGAVPDFIGPGWQAATLLLETVPQESALPPLRAASIVYGV